MGKFERASIRSAIAGLACLDKAVRNSFVEIALWERIDSGWWAHTSCSVKRAIAKTELRMEKGLRKEGIRMVAESTSSD